MGIKMINCLLLNIEDWQGRVKIAIALLVLFATTACFSCADNKSPSDANVPAENRADAAASVAVARIIMNLDEFVTRE